jgi:ABC-type lipoprotein release transport system permease subunit
MTLSVSARYALRSLMRHPRRSFLSVLGIGVGCGVCLFIVAFVRGEGEMLMRAAAESGAGHLRFAPKAWSETRSNEPRLPDWETLLGTLRGDPRVALAAPRARTEALLGFGTRVAGVEMAGVDPDAESKLNRMVRRVTDGRYIAPEDDDMAVIGRTLADRLGVGSGDDLMVTVTGEDGELHGAMLRVVGVTESGSRDIDATICHVTLATLESLTGRAGAAEITVLLEDPGSLDAVSASFAETVPGEIAVLTWKDLIPELASGVEVDKTWSRIMVGLVVTVVFLGIASAQLAAVLDRRREFAVLAALGMKTGRITGILMLEGLALGLAGWIAALIFSLPPAWYVSVKGINFGALMPEADLTLSNILMDPVVHGDFGWWLFPLAGVLSLAATLMGSLYPAWHVAKTDPAGALRVDR